MLENHPSTWRYEPLAFGAEAVGRSEDPEEGKACGISFF